MNELGQTIRGQRQARGWSLKKLSNLIGVSIMTLQRIETGKVSPSVELLIEIAYQLGLPVTDFVGDKLRTLVHLKNNDLPEEQDGPLVRRCLFPKGLVTEDLSVWLGEYEPGTVIDWASGNQFEGSYVMSGQAEIEFDDRKVRQQTGETLYFDARFRQRVKSNTGAEAILVMKA